MQGWSLEQLETIVRTVADEEGYSFNYRRSNYTRRYR